MQIIDNTAMLLEIRRILQEIKDVAVEIRGLCKTEKQKQSEFVTYVTVKPDSWTTLGGKQILGYGGSGAECAGADGPIAYGSGGGYGAGGSGSAAAEHWVLLDNNDPLKIPSVALSRSDFPNVSLGDELVLNNKRYLCIRINHDCLCMELMKE
jgi:hypothetical protein